MQAMLIIQGIFYLITGIWSLISMKSFEKVTGSKVDKWLVKTVGLLVACSGLIFLYSAFWRQVIPLETLLLAALNAGCLTIIDVYYVFKGRISKVYLWDGLAEFIFFAFFSYQLIQEGSK